MLHLWGTVTPKRSVSWVEAAPVEVLRHVRNGTSNSSSVSKAWK
jgi:hypothetical protein|nr:hypothetical protein [Actinomyces sp.]